MSKKGAPAQAAKEPAMIEVRLLRDSQYGSCNDVAAIPRAAVSSLKAAGFVDDEAAAVEYAKTLPQNQRPIDVE